MTEIRAVHQRKHMVVPISGTSLILYITSGWDWVSFHRFVERNWIEEKAKMNSMDYLLAMAYKANRNGLQPISDGRP